MGVTEVTQEQWQRVMGSKFTGDWEGAKRPVHSVSWFDAHKFIERLNKKEGVMRYRLPTEAEWEYAARAGTTTRYYYGDKHDETAQHCTRNILFDVDGSNKEAIRRGPAPVAQKKPNPWGLYDMYGNVWEWVWDWYDETYYTWSKDTDPLGPEKGEQRVIRGGGFFDPWPGGGGCATFWSSPERKGHVPGDTTEATGFRLVMTAE